MGIVQSSERVRACMRERHPVLPARFGGLPAVMITRHAALARCLGFALATRNTSDFEQTPIDLVNP